MTRLLFLVLLTAFAFSGCKNTSKQENGTDIPAETTKPVVYVSNYPLYYFASRIGGDRLEIHFPAATLTDPSGWSPPADTVAAMQQADLRLTGKDRGVVTKHSRIESEGWNLENTFRMA